MTLERSSPCLLNPFLTALPVSKIKPSKLLKDYRNGGSKAVASFSEHHPRGVDAERAKLTDAQLVTARSRGFDSWPRLHRSVVGDHLRLAIWDGNIETVEHAVRTDPEIVDEPGKNPRWGGEPSPLQLAAERGQSEILRLLVSEGADIDATQGYAGWTALHLAAHWNYAKTASALLDLGATVDIFAAVLLDDTGHVEQLLAEDPSCAITPCLSGGPPLHRALSPEVAALLVRHGASLDTTDGMGNTPLGSALSHGERGRSVARYLIDSGAEACQLAALGETTRLEALLDTDKSALFFTGKIGVNAVVGTLLLAAVAANEIETTRRLLEWGPDPKARADMGQKGLYLCKSVDVAHLLVDAGADPLATDAEHGTTPLEWARVGSTFTASLIPGTPSSATSKTFKKPDQLHPGSERAHNNRELAHLFPRSRSCFSCISWSSFPSVWRQEFQDPA